MTRGALPALAGLEIGDEPEVWHRLGFVIGADRAVQVGGVALRLTGRGAGEGIRSWTLRAAESLPPLVDGIPTRAADGAAEPPTGDAAGHPNGATALDHVVVTTPDLPRTLAELEAIGMQARRVREAGTPERPLRQAFLWAGDVLIEVAGPPEPESDEPARLWGLVIVLPQLEPLLELPGPPVKGIRDAVQPGRQIAPVRREAGSSVPIAFMTPHRSSPVRLSEAAP